MIPLGVFLNPNFAEAYNTTGFSFIRRLDHE